MQEESKSNYNPDGNQKRVPVNVYTQQKRLKNIRRSTIHNNPNVDNQQ